MHAVGVELDFVQPVVAVRRRVDQLGELRRNRFRQSGAALRLPATAGSMRAGDRELRCGRTRREIPLYPSATARRAPTVKAAS
jgi:hypothetical protein